MQAPVTALSPVVAQYDPAVQAEQAMAPVADMNVPVRQLAQLVAEEDETYFPAGHCEHAAADVAE